MKYVVFVIFLFSTSSLNCSDKANKYSVQIKTAKELLKAVAESDTFRVKKILVYGYDEKDLSTYRSILSMRTVKEAILTLKRNCLDQFKFQEYASNSPRLVDVIVPLCDPFTEDDYIVISFVKFARPDLVLDFELHSSRPKNFEDVVPPK